MIKKQKDNKSFQSRIFFVAWVFFIAYIIILSRSYQLQILGNQKLNRLVNTQHKSQKIIKPKRGNIYDRNGHPLALDVTVASVGVHPHRIKNKSQVRSALTKWTSISATNLDKKLASKKKFVWIERRIPLKNGKALSEKKFKGVQVVQEYRRFYPNGHLAGQVLGAVGYDAKALGGIELYYDNYLKSKTHKTEFEKDARGKSFDIHKDSDNLNHVYLTIDKTIQYFTEKALIERARFHDVKNGFAVVADAKTGEILALANYPSFDPNKYWLYPQKFWKNHAVQDLFEPGSIFKTISLASALESGKVKPTDKFHCEFGSYKIGKHTIRDHGANYGKIDLKKIIQVSSNIGVTKMAKVIGKETLYETIKKLNFGEKTGVEFQGEHNGFIKNYKKWREIEFSNISFGQGLTVNGLQMVKAYLAFANNGEVLEPFTLRSIVNDYGQTVLKKTPQKGEKILNEKNITAMKDILHSVTLKEGTAPQAYVKGYLAAGKTGTAQKVDPEIGGYSKDDYVSSFIGFAPLNDPEIVVAVVFDTPQKNGYYGGVTAGPVFREIVKNSLGYLGLAPNLEKSQRWAWLKGEEK